MVTEKSMLAIAKMFRFAKLNHNDFTMDKFYWITEELEDNYDIRQLETLCLNTLDNIKDNCKEYIRRERKIELTKKKGGMYVQDYCDKTGKRHGVVMSKIKRKMDFVINNLQEDIEDYFIETVYHTITKTCRTYYLTNKGYVLIDELR